MLFSKSTLAIALAATATTVTAESLRGPVVQSTLDQLPSPDIHCNKKAHDSSNCSSVESSTGDNCVWCQVKENEGACLSQDDAGYVMDLFNLPCPEYAQLLEEGKKPVETPDFMCMLASIGGEQACEQVTASDGSNCVWCTGTHAPSACLSTKDAKIADDKFGLSCPSVNEDVTTEEVEVSDQPNIDPGMIDTTCFMAAFNAENAEEACGTTEAQDGSQCVWCETQGDTMGACLHSKQAEIADGKYGLSCPSEKVATYVDTDRD
mmetsp:Transcript_25565/g.38061  ORF Transcript_25565/g.38061 Transcript_25565/m.38061 type:complete len:264 (-) Transcript_25565:117-908(-)